MSMSNVNITYTNYGWVQNDVLAYVRKLALTHYKSAKNRLTNN